MILEQNYRKISEYTQKSFRLYSRRYLAHLMLQVLRTKQSINQFQTAIPDGNRTSTFIQKDWQGDLQHVQEEKEWERNHYFSKTSKNIDRFDKQMMLTNISYLRYGDFIFLEIYNYGMNTSDKKQRLRVYSQLNSIKYSKIQHLQSDIFSNKKSLFQIIHPFNANNQSILKGCSLFCLKHLQSNKYICLTQKLKLTVQFGYEISLKSLISPECFLEFKGLESKSKEIISYQPVGIKLGTHYLRAEGSEICGSIEGSVFYLNKVNDIQKEQQPQFVKIKNISVQKFLSSSEIDMNKLMTKKTFSNVTIEDSNGLPIKENQLVFTTLDFNKFYQSDIQLNEKQQQTLKNVWILSAIQKNGVSSDEIKIVNAVSGKFFVVKNDKTLKLSSNHLEASSFKLFKKSAGKMQQKNKKFTNQNTFETDNESPSQFYEKDENFKVYHEIIFQQSNITVQKSKDEFGQFCLGINELLSLSQQKVQKNESVKFQLIQMDDKQTLLIQQLIQIESVLKKIYIFVQKIGFVFDERSQSLKFCVEQIRKSNYEIIYYNQLMNIILSKIRQFIEKKNQNWISIKKVQNYVKQLKILETLICMGKMISLKVRKRKHFQEGQGEKQNVKLYDGLQRVNQSPFQVCWEYYESLQRDILNIILVLVKDNRKCSAVIVQECSFFNKILKIIPDLTGTILQEAIKNLSFFTYKASNNDCAELLQWAKLLQQISQSNIKVQTTYIKIIAEVVIDPNDQGITIYQNKCRELLFNQRNKNKIIPRFAIEDQKPTITFQSTNHNEFLYANPNLFQIQPYSSSQSCFFIEDFFSVTQKGFKNKNYIDYIRSVIHLMRNLCKDRNKKLIKITDQYGFDKSHIVTALNSVKIDWFFKMQYLLLYSSIHVDQDPFLQFQRREVKCHIWTKIKQLNLHTKTALVFKQYTDLTSAIQKLKDFDIDVLPFLQSYLNQSSQNTARLFVLYKEGEYIRFNFEVENEIKSFEIFTKFIYESMKFGYFSIWHIKRYVYFVISQYQSICNLFQCHRFCNAPFQFDQSYLLQRREVILNEILKILNLNQKIWIDINSINLLKTFEKNYTELNSPFTAIQLREHCWKLLNYEIPILTQDQHTFPSPKNNSHLNKKKTTKNMFLNQIPLIKPQDKLDNEFDEEIGKFLVRMLLVLSQMSYSQSYKGIIQVISLREKRNLNINESISSFLILNGKKQQTIYRDYSGRISGKILNVNKFYDLILKIKNSSNDPTQDPQNFKKTKEKLLQLNNLVSKIRRELTEMRDQERNLFSKMQRIIQKLNIDIILLQLLQFSHQSVYTECISNLYKFYLEFISENEFNKNKLSRSFQMFLKNVKIQRSPLLISELYIVLSYSEKRKYIGVLFQKLHFNSGGDLLIKQSILETIYRIMRKIEQKNVLSEIKSQLSFQIMKENDYDFLFQMDTNLSTQYINVLCELGSESQFVFTKMKKNYTKSNLRNLLYQQHQYPERTSILKLFYYLYVKKSTIENHQIQNLISDLILPQIQHLPSVTHYIALQNIQIKQNDFLNKKYPNLNNPQSQYDVDFFKNKFQDLILFQKTPIQPSEQQKYWNFIYNIEDQTQMSLINFTLLLLKQEIQSNSQRNFNGKKLSKSVKYNGFIKYLTELCQFLKELFKWNNNQYQRKVLTKIQEILILNKQKNESHQKTVYENILEKDKKFLTEFFEQLSTFIISSDISYTQIMNCARVNSIELGKRRAGQNVEKMILQEQFMEFMFRIGRHANNIKEFNKIINEKKLSYFFNLYRCNKLHKINIYKFLQKLIEYLESLKNKSISELNEPFDNIKREIKSKQQNLDYIDAISNNELIETHFTTYYKRHEVVLKLLIISKWKFQQQKYFKLVLKDLQKQSLNQILVPFDQYGNKSFSLVEFYLSRICGNKSQFKKSNSLMYQNQEFQINNGYFEQEESFLSQQDCINTMLQIDLSQQRGGFTFSKIVLLILKEVNKRQNIKVIVSKKGIKNYIQKKLQLSIAESSITLNQILMQLILNFNTKTNQTHSFQFASHNLQNLQNSTSSFYSSLHKLTKMRGQSWKFFSINKEEMKYQGRQFAMVIYSQIIKTLKKKINLISNFNFKYNLDSCLSELNHSETHVPSNFKFKLSILSYGFQNGLILNQQVPEIETSFIKILYIWADKKNDFSDLNWLTILQSIIQFIDTHFTDLNNFAILLAKSTIYIQRYHQLVNQCCLSGIKATNIKSMTKVQLLYLLTQFHIKFYLLNQKDSLAKIFNQLDFRLLASSANACFQQSLQPKIEFFQNQSNCDLVDPQHQQTCTYEICNQQKVTKNDNRIMETFVIFLIIIQLSITLQNKKLFPKPLKTTNLQVLNHIHKSLREKKEKNHNKDSQNLNWIQFYRRFIGLVYFISESGSLIPLYFKVPFIQKYCKKTFKQEALYYLKRQNQSCIEKLLFKFSKFLQAQLEDRKSQQQFPFVPLILSSRNVIRRFIILVNFIHVVLLMFPTFSVNEVIFYPFTCLFILIRIIFTLSKFRKAHNIIACTEQQRKMSLIEKATILMTQKVFISAFLILLYIASFLINNLFSVIVLLEILTIRQSFNFCMLLLRSFVHNFMNILRLLIIIIILHGLLNWRKEGGQQFLNEIFDVIKQFYTFTISNMKISTQYDYKHSNNNPLLFFVYSALIFYLIYKNLLFFITEMKKEKDHFNQVENICLICRRKKTDFQSQDSTFQQHTQFEHNVWHYLYFFIYLRNSSNKQKQNLKNIQLLIKQKIDNQNYDFMNIRKLV